MKRTPPSKIISLTKKIRKKRSGLLIITRYLHLQIIMLPYIKLEKQARSILCEHSHDVTMVIARAYRLTDALF